MTPYMGAYYFLITYVYYYTDTMKDIILFVLKIIILEG